MREATDDEGRELLRTWCHTTISLALSVRARRLGKSIPEHRVSEPVAYAAEVYQRVLSRAGPETAYGTPQLWMMAVADAMFVWAEDYLSDKPSSGFG